MDVKDFDMYEEILFETLKGKILTEIIGAESYHDEILFVTSDGERYKMYHRQDCCESVSVEEIIGDIQDLIGSPILEAEESGDSGDHGYGTFTWTFYKLGTIKGHVNIRWYGSSNGYYSESVSFMKID